MIYLQNERVKTSSAAIVTNSRKQLSNPGSSLITEEILLASTRSKSFCVLAVTTKSLVSGVTSVIRSNRNAALGSQRQKWVALNNSLHTLESQFDNLELS